MKINSKVYELQIVLDIMSFPDEPADIVRLIGVIPHRAAKQGEKDPDKVIPRKNIVSYRSNAAQFNSPIEDHLNDFMNKFSGKESIIKEISDRAKVLITILVKPKEEFPVLFLSRELIKFAHDINVEIDISVYDGLFD